MFKFGRKYFPIKYKLVYFQPSVENLQRYILQLEDTCVEHYTVLARTLQEKGYTSVAELLNNPDDFFHLVYELFDEEYPEYLLGIKNIETGEIDYKFHGFIYDYHPNEGYVILRKYCDLDYDGSGLHLIILSLKTGKELEGLLVSHISGIENLKFHAVTHSSLMNNHPSIFEIDESHQTINEIGLVPDGELNLFIKPSYLEYVENDIEIQDSDDFYYYDDSFYNYCVRGIPDAQQPA